MMYTDAQIEQAADQYVGNSFVVGLFGYHTFEQFLSAWFQVQERAQPVRSTGRERRCCHSSRP